MSFGSEVISRAKMSRCRFPPDRSRAWVSIVGAAPCYSDLSSSARWRATTVLMIQPFATGGRR